MPEGDTIYRTAAQLRRALSGQTICTATAEATSDISEERVTGRIVAAIEARGKHLLIHLDDERAIHTHLGMTGSWHVYRPDQPWYKPAHRAALVLGCPAAECVCFSPKTLEILSAAELRRHPHLSRLGPDLLGERFDADEVVRRLRQQPDLTLGQAVMDQRIVAGIGNVYKSELLFLERLDPFATIEAITDDELRQMLLRAVQLMRRNLQGYPRTTRFGRDGQRLWVYGRSGELCLTCGTRIQMRRQGDLGRSTYWCPNCQARAGNSKKA